MIGLLGVHAVRVPTALAVKARDHLARVGEGGDEGIALWAGVREGETFYVRETVIPQQRGLRLGGGICATVEGEELHRINVWLYEHGLTLVAQLHSHPTEAYHSETDDAYPIVTTLGGLSLVVPDFAAAPFSLARCAVYRLMPSSGWVRLPASEVETLILLEE